MVERRDEAGPRSGPASTLCGLPWHEANDRPSKEGSRPADHGPASCFWGGGAAMRYVAIESLVPADEQSLKPAHGVRKDLLVDEKTAAGLAAQHSFARQLAQPRGNVGADRIPDGLGDVEANEVE